VAPYPEYMANLARSAVVLQSFPFGGTNTTMDALALGIPVVCLDSGDMAGAADPAIQRAAGLGDACVDTPERFVALARSLLESAPQRAAFRAAAGAALARAAAWEPVGSRTLADAVAAAREAGAPR
jgi:predicted O-linked N-acetylglucosamine transferase (SPINDLY family)